MSDINLKPCPFCGGKAQLHGNGKFSWVNCLECGVETPGDATSDTEAIASWNVRANAHRSPVGWVPVSVGDGRVYWSEFRSGKEPDVSLVNHWERDYIGGYPDGTPVYRLMPLYGPDDAA